GGGWARSGIPPQRPPSSRRGRACSPHNRTSVLLRAPHEVVAAPLRSCTPRPATGLLAACRRRRLALAGIRRTRSARRLAAPPRDHPGWKSSSPILAARRRLARARWLGQLVLVLLFTKPDG